MAIMHSEWTGRLRHWLKTLKDDFYMPLGEIKWTMARTMDQLSLEEAEKQDFTPVEPGFAWGYTHEYGWFKGQVTLPKEAEGERIVMNLNPDGESTIFVNGKAFGNYRADWVREQHHFMVDNFLTRCGHEGETYDILMETYAGHYYPESTLSGCSTGPVLPGAYQDPKVEGQRLHLGSCTYGIWNETAYQLYMDADTLWKLLEVLDENSLRAAKIAEALEQFTLVVDFEQDRQARIKSYEAGREVLRPALEAKNGSTMPQFYAVGNSHLDLAWLWPMAETYRKTARTFGAQLRLIEEYPEYRFIQSQPASYEMCRKYYPELFERILEAAKEGQWIADGAMWVEPDTNMASGEALIRQLVYGKRYYQEVFGIDSQILWLPDTFGYTAALPQILKGCGVNYLVTQKIFWSYNEGDKFPYHYFTWEGMDGSQIVSFLPTSYTYYTSPTEANKVWQNRTQKRDIDAFLFPYGYGDGGGGPVRDYIEYTRRQEDLEGSVRMKMTGPLEFFEDMQALGGPKNTYRGELYFSAHRGTYTSQAKVKENNRRAELGLRELEMWGSIAQAKDTATYPLAEADALWKETLLHQFHDILPGSGIKEIYEETEQRMNAVVAEAKDLTASMAASLVQPGEGITLFNSLSAPRRAVITLPAWAKDGVITAEGEAVPTATDGDTAKAMVTLPPCGTLTLLPAAGKPAESLAGARVSQTEEGFVLENEHIRATVDAKGEVTSFLVDGHEMAAGPMNHLQFYKDVPRLFDAWDIDSNYIQQELPGAQNVTVSLEENNGAVVAVRVKGEIGESTYTQVIRLEAGSERLEFETEVDWKELHRLLKVGFPVDVYADNVINEMQFGYVERPVHRSRLYDKDRFEVCNHRYSALCDRNHGAAVLNDSKYGMSANGNRLELTLLRAAAAPEMRADNRVHHFTYAFTAWEGAFVDSSVVRQGYELNVPVQQVEGVAKAGSFFNVESDRGSVILDTVKPAEDGSGDLVLRLYESKKMQTGAKLRVQLPGQWTACDTDMLERTAEGEPSFSCEKEGESLALTFAMRPFEIKTLRLKRS